MAITISDLFNNYDLPWPKYNLEWGKDMPKDVAKALKETKCTALLHDENGEPIKVIIWDPYCQMFRETPWSTFRRRKGEYN